MEARFCFLVFLNLCVISITLGQQAVRRPGKPAAAPPVTLGKVTGPKKGDRIAVIGDDSSAVHMTYLLEKAGHKPILLLSKALPGVDTYSDYLPRKDNVPFPFDIGTDQGYIWNKDSYMRKLLTEVAYPGDFRKMPPVRIWHTLYKKLAQGSMFAHNGEDLALLKSQRYTLTTAKNELSRLLNKYKTLHAKIFGAYNVDNTFLPPRPDNSFTDDLNVSIADFLKKNDLTPLRTVFSLFISAFNLGRISDVPMMYGCMLITPKVIDQVMEYYKTSPKSKTAFVSTLNHGYDSIWSWIAKRQGLTVKRNHNVYKIYANYDSNKVLSNYTVFYRKDNCKKYKRTVQFLVLSNNVGVKLSKLIRNATQEELEKFKNIRYDYTTASIAKFAVTKHCLQRDVFFKNILSSNRSHDVFSYRAGHLEGQGVCSPKDINQPKLHYGIFFQFHPQQKTKKSTSLANLEQFMRDNGLANSEMIERRRYKSAPKFPQEEVANGILHDIWEMQGKNNRWYIGPQVSFDCLECMLKYNLQLVNSAKPRV